MSKLNTLTERRERVHTLACITFTQLENVWHGNLFQYRIEWESNKYTFFIILVKGKRLSNFQPRLNLIFLEIFVIVIWILNLETKSNYCYWVTARNCVPLKDFFGFYRCSSHSAENRCSCIFSSVFILIMQRWWAKEKRRAAIPIFLGQIERRGGSAVRKN